MKDWDKLSADEKKVFTRHQEIFAAFADVTDHEIGRVVQAIEDIGAMDNTLIIYITGDTGSSDNGGPTGRFNTLSSLTRSQKQLRPARIWMSLAANTRNDAPAGLGDRTTHLTYASFYGGTTNGVVIHYPKAIKAKGVRPQYHLTSTSPHSLEAAGARTKSRRRIAETDGRYEYGLQLQ